MNRRPMSESYANSQAGQSNNNNQNTTSENSNNNQQHQDQQQQQQQQQQPDFRSINQQNSGSIPQLMCATELTNLLLEFAFSVFVNKPEDIVDYAANYFTQLRNQRPSGVLSSDQQQQQQATSSSSNVQAANGQKRPSADSQRSSYSSGSANDYNNLTTNQTTTTTNNNSNNNQDNSYPLEDDDQFNNNKQTMPNNVQFSPKTTFNRRKSVFAEHYDPANDAEEDENVHVVHGKTDEQRQRLAKSIKSIFMFRCVDSQDMANILDAMFEVKVKKGDVVIKQGDDGDNFYVIERGKFQIYKTLDNNQNEIRGEYEDNGSFGELALMYNQPRAATVIALSDGSLWAMDRSTFRRIVLKSAFRKRREYEKFFEKVSILSGLDGYERMNLCDALVTKHFSNGERIINQGDQANGMYFIESGNVKIIKQLEDGRILDVATLGKGDYFGELALINHKPRAASVYAMGDDVKLAFLDVKAFERLLGSCIERMEKKSAMYLNELAQVEARQNV